MMKLNEVDNLNGYFGEIIKLFHTGEDEILLKKTDMKYPSIAYNSDDIFIEVEAKYCGGFHYESINFFMEKRVYRNLGLLIFSLLFSDNVNESKINLSPSKNFAISNHDKQQVTSLILNKGRSSNINGYERELVSFQYFEDVVDRGCLYNGFSLKDLPCFQLTNANRSVFTDEEWNNRDVCEITGTEKSLATLAELFLNMSSEKNDVHEVRLENELGNRGVGIASAEAVFHIVE